MGIAFIGGANSSLSFPEPIKVPFTAGVTESVFQSSDGEALFGTNDLPATFCNITERL